MPFVLFHQLRWQAFGLIADKSHSENINTHTHVIGEEPPS